MDTLAPPGAERRTDGPAQVWQKQGKDGGKPAITKGGLEYKRPTQRDAERAAGFLEFRMAGGQGFEPR